MNFKKIILYCMMTLFIFNFNSECKSRNFSGMNSFYGIELLKDSNGDNSTFYRFGIQPEFKMKEWKIGMDFQFFIDEDGNFRKNSIEDNSTFLDYFNFIQYRERKDRMYIRMGFIEDITFGNGSIVNSYSNKVRYPEEAKKNGFYFHKKNKFDDGIEFFINDIDNVKVFGGRIFIVPVDDVTIGAGFAIDKDPDLNPATSDKLEIYGVDFSTPLFRGISKRLLLFEDFTRIKHFGDCFSSGLKYDSGYRAKFRLEYRNYDSDFIPGIISKYYEIEKNDKYADIQYFSSRKDSVKSINIWAEYNLLDIAIFELDFQEFDSYDIHPTLNLKVDLSEKFMNGIKITWEYVNKDADWSDFSTPLDKKDVFTLLTLNMATGQGADLTVSRKRIVDENGNTEHIVSFSSGFKIK